jgi:RNA polymerase sigma-70 factor (ECF subfamily)
MSPWIKKWIRKRHRHKPSAAILNNGIAALFHSTGFFVFLSFPENYVAIKAGIPRCRGPPLQSDFSHKSDWRLTHMAYNKAGEEKKWRAWKAAEEEHLRELGVGEEVIKQLRNYDWDDFKAERRFFEHCPDTGTYLDHRATEEPALTIRTVGDLLDDIDNEELHRLLLTVDKLTLRLILMKLDGYTSTEMAAKTGLSLNAVKLRFSHLKKKIKNIL